MNATRFLDTLDIRLTPLTPIHIGCGVDFEPTNYVISDGVLYHFDPSRVPLEPRDRQELLAAVNGGGAALRRIQRFFHERRPLYTAHSHLAIPVAAGVSAQYEARIGQVAQRESDGRDVGNMLEIERTAHHPNTGIPFIPGSSLKGAMRTAWLDGINRGRGQDPQDRNAAGMERRLLRGAFHQDPFRLLALSDAQGATVVSKVLFSTNHKKRPVFKDGVELKGAGPATRREALLGGQHAIMSSQARFALLPGQHPREKVPESRIVWRDLAAACNRYYLPRLARLLELLESRGFADPQWLAGVRQLVEALNPSLDAGHAVLLRVGRHSGAESVTLDGVRQIRIMQGRHARPRQSDEATTVWLAAERENVTRGALLPFGWLLVEPADAPESEPLRTWCEQQPKPDLGAVRAALAQAQAEAREAARAAAEEQSRRQAAAEAEARAREVEAAVQARRTPQQRDIHALAQALSDRVAALKGGKDRPNNQLHGQARAMARRAVAENWPAADRQALADVLEKQLPAVFQLDWRDERKKLQIAALRGSTP